MRIVAKLCLNEDWMKRLEIVKSDLDYTDSLIILTIMIFHDHPKVTRYILDFFWIVQEQLLVEIWELIVFNHHRHNLIGISRLRVIIE